MVMCRDKTLYTGVTRHVEIRVAQHNLGEDPDAYTFSRRPVRLVWCERFTDIFEAIRFEKQLKGWSRKKKLALIRGDWRAIVQFSRE